MSRQPGRVVVVDEVSDVKTGQAAQALDSVPEQPAEQPDDTAQVQRSTSSNAVEQAPAPQPAASQPGQSAPAPKPKPKPIPTTSVTISADGCKITITGKPGLIVEVHTSNDRKGGVVDAVIPASGGLTITSGGIQGMTVEAKVFAADNNSTVLAQAKGTITKTNCQ